MGEILALGLFLAIGFFGGSIINKFKLPAVTGYLIAGLIVGVSFLNIIPEEIMSELSFLEDMALGFIAFNIGESFNIEKIKLLGSKVVVITIIQATVTILFVTGGVYLATNDLPLGIVFGALSAATAPAATINVIKEYKAKGSLTNMIMTVVALDDAVCLFLFSIACAVAQSILSGQFNMMSAFGEPLIEIVVSLVIGIGIGMIFSLIGKKRREKKHELLIMSWAAVLVGAGLGTLLNMSPILICMGIGATIANFCKRHDEVFMITEDSINPIYVIFFVMAGYHLDLKLVMAMGLLGIAFIVSRFIGKIIGAYIGCSVTHTDTVTKKYLGSGLMPMAGVGVGLAVAAAKMLPEYGAIFLNIVMAATFVFEIIGPIMTAKGLKQAGEIKE